MVILFYYVFFVGISCVKTDTEADGYSGEVNALFDDLIEYTSQVADAKDKMNEFQSETWDKKYAIALINLYTQPGKFHLTLNLEMKRNYPAATDVWRRAGSFINKGVDILGPKTFDQVYKGCQALDDLPIPGKEYTFNHIIKVNQLKAVEVGYIACANKFLFQVDHAYGVSVEKYSYFSDEKEVIIKSSHKLNVVDGPHKDGQYDIYFLSGQASESVSDENKNDVISVTLGSSPCITFAILLVHLFTTFASR